MTAFYRLEVYLASLPDNILSQQAAQKVPDIAVLFARYGGSVPNTGGPPPRLPIMFPMMVAMAFLMEQLDSTIITTAVLDIARTALQNIHFSNVRFWRKADIHQRTR